MENFESVMNTLKTRKRTHREKQNSGRGEDYRPLSKALLLPAAYSLNTSNSKFVTVGLELINGEEFEVAITFSSRCSIGITITPEEWRELCCMMTVITRWLNEPADNDAAAPPPSSLEIGRLIVRFTTAYKQKAIVIAVKEEEDHKASSKQSKNGFSPDIFMQKVTFDGIVTLIPCINQRIRLLREDLELVKKIRDTLIRKIIRDATEDEWEETTRERVLASGVKIVLEENMGLGRDSIRPFFEANDEEMDEKRRLIGNELMCLHYEHVYQKVSTRYEEIP